MAKYNTQKIEAPDFSLFIVLSKSEKAPRTFKHENIIIDLPSSTL